MGPTKAPNDIVLFNYAASPFGRRISWYLQLRGLGYALCEQPMVMPRPDLAKLGVNYRRIPVLAIGRDVYADTRLILRKLEDKFPDGKLGSDKPGEKFVERLLERFMVEAPVFRQFTGLIPAAALGNSKFAEDRKGMMGRNWTREEMEQERPECLVYVRNLFDLLETTILADGREWILATEKPSLADIQAIWPLDWVTTLGMPSEVVSAKQFPLVYAWISRFRAALKDAESAVPRPTELTGKEAVDLVRGSSIADVQDVVMEKDAQDLKQGARVEICPSDWGTTHRDVGRLVGLAPDEVTIVVEEDMGVRLHAPRTGFKVTAVGRDASTGGMKL